ncbi:MAG: exoribonuclease-2, partial [Myxococcota bacterium]
SLATLLQTARTWMDAHRSGRASRGAVFFQRNEVYMHVEADGRVVRRVGDPYAPARQLVSELMIATCRAVAEVCAEQAIPCIYRTQAAPDTAGTAFAAHPAGAPIVGAAAQMGLLRQLKPAVLSTKPKLHFTLGVGAYTQLSSPIRRYGDLLMHQQLTSLLKTGRPRFSAGQLMAHFDAIEKTTGQIRRVELESKRYWAAVYLAERRDETFAAQVVREHGRRWLVEVSDLALMLPADLRRGVHSGDWVDVSVVKADARAGKILLKHV